MSNERYLTVKDVADLLKVNEVTVRRWIREGELRAIDIGKGWRIGSDDLDTFLEAHATCPAAASGTAESIPEISEIDEIKGQKN